MKIENLNIRVSLEEKKILLQLAKENHHLKQELDTQQLVIEEVKNFMEAMGNLGC